MEAEFIYQFNYAGYTYYTRILDDTVIPSLFEYFKKKDEGFFEVTSSIKITKEEFDRARVENRDDINSLGATAFFFLLITGIIYWFITNLKETVNGL